jgi:2,5-furandicarboxylate decarboxylase 1
VVHVHEEVNARWEAAAIALKAQKTMEEAPVFVFHCIRTEDGSISPFPLVLNLFASRRRLAFAVGSTARTVSQDLFQRRSARVEPVVVERGDAPIKQVVRKGQDVDLTKLSAIVHAAWDPGPYVSAGYLTTYDPDSGVDNCALQRGWIFGPREIRVFPAEVSQNGWNIKKHEERGKDTRVAFWIGHHPAVCIGAAAKMGYPESHYEAAGGLAGGPLRLVPSETLGDDFLVPADAEFVIEGILPRGVRVPEGPFGEYTRYFGGQRLNPVMNVTGLTHRQNPYWVSIITGYGDDDIGALRREGHVFDLVRRIVPQTLDVYRPSTCPYYLYIKIKKTQEWQPRAVLTAAMSAPEDFKHVFVFDEDVDIFDEQEVHWAIGTRADWAQDLIVVPNLRAPTLDPVSVGQGTRTGLDCTKPVHPGVYEQKSFIPDEVMQAVDLTRFTGRR